MLHGLLRAVGVGRRGAHMDGDRDTLELAAVVGGEERDVGRGVQPQASA